MKPIEKIEYGFNPCFDVDQSGSCRLQLTSQQTDPVSILVLMEISLEEDH